MKIVLVHNQRFGGAHRRTSEQFKQLGLPVTEVTLEGAQPLTEDAVIVPISYYGDRPPQSVRPITRYADFLSLLSAYRRLHTTVRKLAPDVIWLNPCRFLKGAWLEKDLASITAYYCDEARRSDYDDSVRHSTRVRTRIPYWPMRRATRYLDRATVASVAAVATNSSYSADQITRAYGRQAEVIPCGVSGYFRPATGHVSRDYLLSVGSLIPTKGHDLAIRAAGQCGLNLPIVVVAPRDDAKEVERLGSIATQSGVEMTVKIGVSDGELAMLYQSALVTLYLAQREPFGLVSIEAQSCGSPVIVSNEGGLPETVVPGVTGWAVARKADDVAARLALFSNRQLAEALGAAASAHAAQWSWSVSAARLRNVIESVYRA